MVFLGPEPLVGRDEVDFSFGGARIVDFPLFLDMKGPVVVGLLSVGEVVSLRAVVSVCVRENDGRLSGEDRRDVALESKEETTGPGIRLSCCPLTAGFLVCVRYFGAMLAA